MSLQRAPLSKALNSTCVCLWKKNNNNLDKILIHIQMNVNQNVYYAHAVRLLQYISNRNQENSGSCFCRIMFALKPLPLQYDSIHNSSFLFVFLWTILLFSVVTLCGEYLWKCN